MPKVKRQTGRAQAAELSRTAIAQTARRLFGERGYNQSTMESIAAEAGYAVQTVYFHFKSKAAILTRLIDELQAEQIAPRYELAISSDSPAEIVQLSAAIAREVCDQGWDLMQALEAAAKGDPALARRLDEWEGGHVFGMTNQIRRLAELRALRPGLDPSTAVDISWALTSPDMYRLLRIKRGWDGDEYEQWLVGALARELLPARSRPRVARA
jgi:AcrR family transcriptional regulator